MKYSNIFLLSLILVMTLVMTLSTVMAAAATVAITTPTSGTVLKNGTSVNATMSGWTGAGSKATNCSLWMWSTATANNTVTSGILSNRTKNTTSVSWNQSINFPGKVWEDGSTYNLRLSCQNATSNVNSTDITGLIIDYETPDAPTGLIPANKSTNTTGSITFTATVNGSETTACNFYFVSTSGKTIGAATSMTHSGNTCTVTKSAIPEQTYYWFVQADDARNYTNSSTNIVSVELSSSSGKSAILARASGVKAEGGSAFSVAGGTIGDTNIPWAVPIVIGIVGLAVWGFKKKKRR